MQKKMFKHINHFSHSLYKFIIFGYTILEKWEPRGELQEVNYNFIFNRNIF